MANNIIIQLPIIKVSSNTIYAGRHWTFRKNLKEKYLKLTKQYFENLEKINSKVNIDFKFYFKRNALDTSNTSYLIKMLEDCLVHYKILVNDNIKCVGIISTESLKGTKDYCIITITDY